jgi:hypothetical protein
MIQAQLNLPKFTNNGKSTRKTLQQLEVEFCELLGGLTTYSGIGKWLNKGKIYNDKINIYQVAIQPSKKKLFIKLSKKYGKLTKQLAIYVIINNKVSIINI